MQFAVLAAGKGTRLAAAGVPKPLVRVGGSSILVRLLSQFAAAGAEEALVAVNAENRGIIAEYLQKSVPLPLDVTLVESPARTPIESLETIMDTLGDGPTVVATTDTVVENEGFTRLINFFKEEYPRPLLAVSYYAARSGLYIIADAEGIVAGFSEEPTPVVSAGIYCFDATDGRRALAHTIAQGGTRLRHFQRNLLEEASMPPRIFNIGEAFDVDTPEELSAANAKLSSHT